MLLSRMRAILKWLMRSRWHKRTILEMTIELPRPRICNCDECFYCYINQKYFHTNNLEKLRAAQLTINVAEYVGPETSLPKEGNRAHARLKKIPIKVCNSGQT
jgi:hypothetical protein